MYKKRQTKVQSRGQIINTIFQSIVSNDDSTTFSPAMAKFLVSKIHIMVRQVIETSNTAAWGLLPNTSQIQAYTDKTESLTELPKKIWLFFYCVSVSTVAVSVNYIKRAR